MSWWTIRRIATQSLSDGKIDLAEANRIIESAKDYGRVTPYEEKTLRDIRARHADKFDPAARAAVDAFLGSLQPPPTANGIEFAPGVAREPVFLTAAGEFVTDKAHVQPRDDKELAAALYRAAVAVDDANSDLFSGLAHARKTDVFKGLNAALAKVPAQGGVPAGMTAVEALQMRSAAATVLLGLLESEGPHRALAFEKYSRLAMAETDRGLKQSMIENLRAVKDKLPAEMQGTIRDLSNQIAPPNPPYEKWFANGNKTINVSWKAGDEEDNHMYTGTLQMLQEAGFRLEENGRVLDATASAARVKELQSQARRNTSTAPTAWMVKTFNPGAANEMTVRMKVDLNKHSIFNDLNDPKFQVVGYDGHSNLGRNVPASLKNAPAGSTGADRLVFYGLCSGKDNLDRVQKRFPDAQIVTTHNSSYFQAPTRRDGNQSFKQMDMSENVRSFLATLEGVANRKDWSAIRTDIKNKGMWGWSHKVSNNYITPTDVDIRGKHMDRDRDGQADVADRLYNVANVALRTGGATELRPVEQSTSADRLDGTVVNVASVFANTLLLYNDPLGDEHSLGQVVANGWFDPKPGEKDLFKFTRAKTPAGQEIVLLQTNSRYAHASEEMLRLAALYEYNRFVSGGTDPVAMKVNGLQLVAASLLFDSGNNDASVWTEFKRAYHFPPELPLDELKAYLDDSDNHDYTGSPSIGRRYLDLLRQRAPGSAEKLARADVGVFGVA